MRQVIFRFLCTFYAIIFCAVPVTLARAQQTDRGLDTKFTRSFFGSEPLSLSFVPTPQKPPAMKVLRDGRLIGYLFSTYEVSGSLGFSGKPIDIHVGLALDGRITGAHIVRHQEPILVLGIPPKALTDFVSGFKGFDIRTRLIPGKPIDELPDAVAGASVSSGVIRDSIIRSARTVAIGHSVFGKANSNQKLDRTSYQVKDWPSLVKEGSIVHRKITMGEVNQRFGSPAGEKPDRSFIDIYTSLATPASIGQNLLKRRIYDSAISKAGVEDNLIMIAANGFYSFRGRAWRKAGFFDRIEIVQGAKTFQLTKNSYQLIDHLQALGAPEFREIGLFTLPRNKGFNPLKEWQLRLLVARGEKEAIPQIETFTVSYKLPAHYIIYQQNETDLGTLNVKPELWMEFWIAQKINIAIVLIMLSVLTAILFFQDALVARKSLYLKVRGTFLVVTFLFLGLYASAQLSVLNVITFIHSLLAGFRWELFLLNPLVFILWGFVAVALLFWGRGVYCGWLCPFGALQELVNIVARLFNIHQIRVPWGLHERLWPIKYVIFLAILAISLNWINSAYRLAEVEPFKTVIILKFVREWPFVLYAVALLIAGIFIERFYCRYLCPLGAALAIPARMRMFEWLKRRRQCGRECRICASKCTVQAIHPMGNINPNECIYCLRCQMNYYDGTTCRALKDRARRRSRPSVPAPPSTTALKDRTNAS